MVTKKRRASFSSSAIPLSAIKETMEGDEGEVELPKSTPQKTVQPKEENIEPHTTAESVEAAPVPVATETDLEAVLGSQDYQDSDLKKKNVLVYRVGVVFVVLVILASVGLYSASLSMNKEKPVVVPAQESTPTPTPTFEPKALHIEVLNGSGVAGAAAKAATKLKDKGYDVVGTGNAKKTENTSLYVSSSVNPAFLAPLLSDMTALFGVSSSSGALLESTASVRLVIGVE